MWVPMPVVDDPQGVPICSAHFLSCTLVHSRPRTVPYMCVSCFAIHISLLPNPGRPALC